MIPTETIPGMGGAIKETNRGGEFMYAVFDTL
jgi:hypothetical protein